MGRRGPPKKPTNLKRLAGNPGCRPLSDNEPAVVATELSPPAGMLGEARKCWIEMAPVLHGCGIFSKTDRHALELYCKIYADLLDAEQYLAVEGMTQESLTAGRKRSAYFDVVAKLREDARKMLIEFGMTPAARSRIVTDKAAKGSKTDAKDDEMFGLGPLPTRPGDEGETESPPAH